MLGGTGYQRGSAPLRNECHREQPGKHERAFERAAAEALPHVIELVKLQKGVDETSKEIKVVEIPKVKEADEEKT